VSQNVPSIIKKVDNRKVYMKMVDKSIPIKKVEQVVATRKRGRPFKHQSATPKIETMSKPPICRSSAISSADDDNLNDQSMYNSPVKKCVTKKNKISMFQDFNFGYIINIYEKLVLKNKVRYIQNSYRQYFIHAADAMNPIITHRNNTSREIIRTLRIYNFTWYQYKSTHFVSIDCLKKWFSRKRIPIQMQHQRYFDALIACFE
jgi:hypothetical protein